MPEVTADQVIPPSELWSMWPFAPTEIHLATCGQTTPKMSLAVPDSRLVHVACSMAWAVCVGARVGSRLAVGEGGTIVAVKAGVALTLAVALSLVEVLAGAAVGELIWLVTVPATV